MPIRIPNVVEHTALVAAFRDALKDTSENELIERILNQDACYSIDEATRKILFVNISEHFAIQEANYVVVGSAQLGFSISQKQDKPRYRSFSEESDIDIAIVSSRLFDQVWQDTFLYFVENRWWHEFQSFQKYFFRGWIRPDKLPYISKFRSEWFDYFRRLSRSQFDSEHEIRCGLYKNNIFLREYQKLSLRDCRNAEAMK